jgi:hypothetical protein
MVLVMITLTGRVTMGCSTNWVNEGERYCKSVSFRTKMKRVDVV